MSDKSVSLAIGGHLYRKMAVETEIPQGSPVSPVLFATYPSRLLKEMK